MQRSPMNFYLPRVTILGRAPLDQIPGESDGQCNRWNPTGSPDPLRGIVAPAAGIVTGHDCI